MTIKHLLGSLLLVLALGACKKGAGGADVEAFMKLDSDKAVAFAAGGTDCEAKAKSVGEWPRERERKEIAKCGRRVASVECATRQSC